MSRTNPHRRQPQPLRRSAGRRLLERLLGAPSPRDAAERGRLLLEPLEPRQMMAGDVDWLSTESHGPILNGESAAALFASSTSSAEGEAANDLVAFAKALTEAGVTFYGAAWCPVCTEQKALFGDGKEELPFVEVTNPDRTLNSVGQANNITTFPTWEFPDGSRATGVLTLAELAERSGVAIPQSENPTFAPIGDLTVEIGSPLHVPIDAYDPDGSNLTVTVSVADPSLLQASVLQGNRSARIVVQNWGEMVFELFEDRAPRPVERFIELAESGFYDADGDDGIIFHRIVDNFVLQTGDPTGTGSGGSTLGDFDDQFHPELQHNRTGILSYAKSLDDTNDSQFFITEGPQRHLDFNHSIFGQLVEGDAVREAMSETAVTNSRPNTDIVIEKVEIFNDNENSVVMFKPTGNKTGATDVTITVTDADGNTFSEVITVTVTPDAVNAKPYLQDIPPVSTPAGTPAVFQLNGVDLEGDPIVYEARVVGNSGATATINQQTREVTVTPAANYSGQILVEVAARSSNTPTSTVPNTRSQNMDLQMVTVNVGPSVPTGIDLIAASDSGTSNTDNITNISPVTFVVTGVTPGATVEILAGDTQIGVGTATGTTATITTNNFAALGNATHIVSARQTINGQTSGKSPSITVTYDSVSPAQVPPPPSQATVGVPYLADLVSPEENAGLRYALVSGPAGLTVATQTGAIAWTPTSVQTGNQEVTVRMTDRAGNSRDQTFTINVGSEPLAGIRLEAVDDDGNVITELAPGEEFTLRIYGNDMRVFTPQGIYALYMDVLFDPSLVEVVSEDPFEYEAPYTNGPSGTVGNGVIEELGAFSSQTNFMGDGERLVVSVRMRALAGGTAVISTDPADASGHEVALFDRDDEVPVNQVQYDSLSLTINASFTAVNDTAVVNEDSANNSILVLNNDTIHTPGTTLSVSSVSASSAEGGTVSLNGSTVRYTPKANFFGVDTFTYTVQDQNGAAQTATVTVTVQPINDPPTANNDTFTANSGSTQNRIEVLQNDTIAPDTGETLKVVSVGTPSAGGTVTIATGGSAILYTPKAGFTGTETITYTISDGTSTDTATVTITVAPGNPPPKAVNDTFAISEDADAADFNVLANDSANEEDETISLDSVTPSSNGTATLSPDGTKLRYKPNANFFGTDRVTYTIRDSNGVTATATATFTVAGVNDPPPAPNRTVNAVRGTTNNTVWGVSDLKPLNVDGTSEALTITAVGTASAGGTVTISSNGQDIVYTPPTSTFTGTDTFTYTVRDAAGVTTTGTLTVDVLDYVPRDFSVQFDFAGTSYTKSAFNGAFKVHLTGEDYRGESVSAEGTYDPATGKVTFADQAPGNYQIEIPAIPFLRNATTPIVRTLSSAADSSSDVQLDVNLGDLASEYLSIRDFLSTAPTSAVFAIVEKGESHSWLTATQNSGTPGNPVVRLSEDGQQVTIEVDNANGNGRRSATLPITSPLVDLRGTSGDFYLLKINVHASAVNYAAVTTSGSGEGEQETSAAAMSTLASTPSTPSTPAPPTVEDDATDSNAATSENFASGVGSGETSNTGGAEGERTKASSAAFAAGTSSPEGESTPPLVSAQAGGDQDEDAPRDERLAMLGDESNDAAAEATDQAMLDLLPALQIRSAVADSLADPDSAPDPTTLDAAFQWLGESRLS